MSNISEFNEGEKKISDEIIAICAINATNKSKGVASLSGGFSNEISKYILGKELTSKGVKVSQSDRGAEVDVHIIVKYDAKIPSIAWDIQENVKNEIFKMTGINTTAVNIHVEGVEIVEEK